MKEKIENRIENLGNLLGLPKTSIDDAINLAKQIKKKHMLRGRSINCIASAIVFIVCKKYAIPMTIKKIAEYAKAEKSAVWNCYNVVREMLEIENINPDIELYLKNIASKLSLDEDVVKTASEIIRKVGKTANGKRPEGLVAAAIYLAGIKTRKYIKEREIAEASNVTEVTLRNNIKRFKQIFGEEIVNV